MFKRIITGLLAATVLLPVAATAQDRDGRGRDRSVERAERGDRGNRGDRGWQQPNRERNDRRDDRRDDRGWDRGRDDRRNFSGGYDRGNRYAGQRWNNGWRQDRRYDWAGYRNTNRAAFRLPRYYAPGGWNYGYRRFSIGSRFAAPLFASSYWIADPWSYRLPPAYGPYRWVRYYGDAVLVDVRTGYIADMIGGIFW